MTDANTAFSLGLQDIARYFQELSKASTVSVGQSKKEDKTIFTVQERLNRFDKARTTRLALEKERVVAGKRWAQTLTGIESSSYFELKGNDYYVISLSETDSNFYVCRRAGASEAGIEALFDNPVSGGDVVVRAHYITGVSKGGIDLMIRHDADNMLTIDVGDMSADFYLQAQAKTHLPFSKLPVSVDGILYDLDVSDGRLELIKAGNGEVARVGAPLMVSASAFRSLERAIRSPRGWNLSNRPVFPKYTAKPATEIK